MGTTKRMAELLAQAINQRDRTAYLAVRWERAGQQRQRRADAPGTDQSRRPGDEQLERLATAG